MRALNLLTTVASAIINTTTTPTSHPTAPHHTAIHPVFTPTPDHSLDIRNNLARILTSIILIGGVIGSMMYAVHMAMVSRNRLFSGSRNTDHAPGTPQEDLGNQFV